jgi:sulfur-oxidizing protein SoxY
MQRRRFLNMILSVTSAVFLLPLQAFAAVWNKAAFEAEKLDDASKSLAINLETPSQDIMIIAPDRAENGAVVQVEITSQIINTETIAIFVEKNPTALIGHFRFSNGAQPFVITRIKMAEDSDIKVIVKAGDKYYTRSKKVVVLENGCG